MSDAPAALPRAPGALASFPALLWGLILVGSGFGIYVLGVLVRFVSLLVDPHDYLLPGLQMMVWSRAPSSAWSTFSSCSPGSGPGATSAGLRSGTRISRSC